MGSITVLSNQTADGFISDVHGNLDWHFPYWDDELCHCLLEALGHANTLLLGRKTYAALAAHAAVVLANFHAAKADQLMASAMTQMNKLVVTSSLHLQPWSNTRFVRGDIEKQLRALQKNDDRNIAVLGSRQLVQSLLESFLVSNIEVWEHPVKIKEGLLLSDPGTWLDSFVLTQTRQLSSGVVQKSYLRKNYREI